MLAGVAPAVLSLALSLVDVTSDEQRRQTLLDYIAHRDDLAATEKKAWDTALRRVFGGKAVVDGADEGVTVAKSVIAASIFFGVKPEVAAKAAYEAYHDAYRWVPPPIAINYQILKLQGRKPKASSRELALNFPKYFDEDIAPDLVSWWDEMLTSGKVPDYEREGVTAALATTRSLMRPMLLDRLWQAAELEARVGAAKTRAENDAVARELARLRQELPRDFRKVAQSGAVRLGGPDYYESYAALARELGVATKARPARPVEQAPRVLEAPPRPREPQRADGVQEPGRAKPTQERPTRGLPSDVIAPREDGVSDAPPADLVQAPLPGEPLLRGYRGWLNAMAGVVGAWVGTPYLFGGTDRRGIDCSAFSRQVFRESLRVELPRNSRAQASLGLPVEQQSQLEPGDLLFFDTMDRGRVTHVGVYLGEGRFAHASSSRGVVQDQLAGRYYQRAYLGSRRILAP